MLQSHENKTELEAKMYQSIVGKAMYVTTKVMIEGANAVRELSKFFKSPKLQHWVALVHFVGYLKGQQGAIVLTIREPMETHFIGLVDANFATNLGDCKSISGGIYTLGGSIISWSSKAQGRSALSLTEAEYYAIALGGQELSFIRNILEELEMLNNPGYIIGDNTGAIQLVRNWQAGQHTKHINIRHHFVRDLWEDKRLKMAYIETGNNKADICTKNVLTVLHKRHKTRIRDRKLTFMDNYNT